jgi:mannose-6-phosphate isomerase-like protein (cupin superfamily)
MFKRVERKWGVYTELFRCKYLCIKVITFKPRSFMNMQRHQFRHEVWLGGDGMRWIKPNSWHAHANVTDDPSSFLEIQFGRDVRESDIERL